jgi:type I restriction enzyme S subunit
LKDISEYQISLPSIKIQNSISEIFEVYEKRREINEKLKQLINQVCPILIKKSID